MCPPALLDVQLCLKDTIKLAGQCVVSRLATDSSVFRAAIFVSSFLVAIQRTSYVG
jgi:hypothetical protein